MTLTTWWQGIGICRCPNNGIPVQQYIQHRQVVDIALRPQLLHRSTFVETFLFCSESYSSPTKDYNLIPSYLAPYRWTTDSPYHRACSPRRQRETPCWVGWGPRDPSHSRRPRSTAAFEQFQSAYYIPPRVEDRQPAVLVFRFIYQQGRTTEIIRTDMWPRAFDSID